MKSSKKLQISSHLLFVYVNNQDRKWHMSVLVFSSALGQVRALNFTAFPSLANNVAKDGHNDSASMANLFLQKGD